MTDDTPFEELMSRLEKTLGRLAEGSAPLEDLVSAHQEALRLLALAEARLAALRERSELIARSFAE